MKTLFIFVFFMASNLFAHGLIEKLDCKNKEGLWHIEGVEAKKEFKPEGNKLTALDIKLKEKGIILKNADTVAISMEDEVKGKEIIEHLKFSLGNKVGAHLMIQENHEKKRSGKGRLTYNKKKIDLDCQVVYE